MKRFDYNYTVFRCKVWIKKKNGYIRMNVEDEEEEYEIISTMMFVGMWGVAMHASLSFPYNGIVRWNKLILSCVCGTNVVVIVLNEILWIHSWYRIQVVWLCWIKIASIQ